ncbi:MAG TPA: Uma2 family endonuclease [Epsilonproteobacteria bacterium]|nr:Uma2 family endonuclease [Campylobacterota bacterium]
MSVVELLHYTYDDYANWEGDWELIEGIPVSMAPAPVRIHQRLASEMFLALNKSLSEECETCEALYEMDWKVSDETVVRPDLVLSCDDEHESYLAKAPRLVVEILSPSTAKKDETVKFDIYESEGVKYYILVYPDDLKAKVYVLKEGKYIKLGDFTHELLTLDDLECEIRFDFSEIFGKFRK